MLNKVLRKIRYELKFVNTNYKERLSDKIFKTYYQGLLKRKIKQLEPLHTISFDAKFTVCMFSSHRNFIESIAAIYSFCYWEKNIHLHYHEDGTLTENDLKFIKKLFPEAVIFRNKEQASLTKSFLESNGFDLCSKLRSQYIISIRLFDTILQKKTDHLLQFDSDVLFFSRPQEILDVIADESMNGCFNKDVVNAYTFPPEIQEKYIVLPIIQQLNVGVFLHKFNSDFFAFAEEVLKNEPQSFQSWHIEQTLMALYATKMKKFKSLPIQYDLARKQRNLRNDLISEHYCHSTGYDFHKDFIYKLFPLYTRDNN